MCIHLILSRKGFPCKIVAPLLDPHVLVAYHSNKTVKEITLIQNWPIHHIF
jgi:hypothetical protein